MTPVWAPKHLESPDPGPHMGCRRSQGAREAGVSQSIVLEVSLSNAGVGKVGLLGFTVCLSIRRIDVDVRKIWGLSSQVKFDRPLDQIYQIGQPWPKLWSTVSD